MALTVLEPRATERIHVGIFSRCNEEPIETEEGRPERGCGTEGQSGRTEVCRRASLARLFALGIRRFASLLDMSSSSP